MRYATLLIAIAAAASIGAPSWAAEPDGVTGLPSDITSILSMAGTWQPVDDQYINSNCSGTVVSPFAGVFTTDSSRSDNIIATSWQYCGFRTGNAVTPVHFAIFRQQSDGTMKVDTSSFVPDSLTSGGGSVVVADFNGDGFPDIFLAAHNESPFIGMPSTALLSNGSGGFTKVTLTDHIMAHDAELAFIGGVPTVITATYPPQDTSSGAKWEAYPMYKFTNGAFNQILGTKLSYIFPGAGGSMTGASVALAQFAGAGRYQLLVGDYYCGAGLQCQPQVNGYFPQPQTVGVFSYTNGDIIQPVTKQISAYFNSRSQYAQTFSEYGPGNTHTYRTRIDDFNHDGTPDVVALGSLWKGGVNTYPSAIQMLQNDGAANFADNSDTLAGNINPQQVEFDYTFQIRDLDNSGINSYVSSELHFPSPFANQADFILVNDGTGKLHVAVFSQMTAWANQVGAYANKALATNVLGGFPKFIPYVTANGKINFLALTGGNISKNGVATDTYAAVNVPVQLDLAKQYTAPMTVTNRNGSHLIRTFAGDDTIYSGNNGGYSHVDGGLGNNKVIYAGPRANYTISQNGDGSWTVVDNKGNDGTDTLVRIQTAQFTDTSVTLSSTPPALHGGAVFSTAQSASQSFLRFLNTGSSAGTVTVTLRDFASGQSLGSWTSPSIPALSEQQFAISTVEAGASITGTKPAYYSIDAQAGFTGEFQHVLFRPTDGTLTNLSTCQSIVTADPTTIAGVHTSILASGFPSSVAITNTGTAAATAILDIYDARNGTKLGTYTSASIPAGAQVIATVASIETAAGVTPSGSMYHYVIKARTPFTGFLQNLVNNTAVSVVTDMTTSCSLNGAASTAAAPILSDGAVFSTAQSSSQSFLRFFNTGASDGTVTVTLKDYSTGQTIGSWTSPDIAALSEQQFAISTVEAAAGVGATKPQYYSISVRSNIAGYFQHVLWRPADGTLTNLSTCGAGVSTDPAQVSGVHTSTVGSGFPSSIVINNTGTAAETVALDVYDAATGTKLGTYTSASIPSAGQAVVAVTDIEAAAQITPSAGMFHYVLKAKPGFTGFLQHLVNNTKVGVITDMTTACALAIAGA